MNPVGTLIWMQLGDGLMPREIAEHLARECDIPCEQALRDVLEFVQTLGQQQFLVCPEDEAGSTSFSEWLKSILRRIGKLVWRSAREAKR